MNATKQHKFLDLVKEEKKFELHIETCLQPGQHTNITNPTRSDFFSIGILVKGEVSFRLNLKDEKASANSLLFLSPNTVKQIIHKSDDARFCIVAFTSKFLLQIGIQQHEADMLSFILTNNNKIIGLVESEVFTLLKLIEDLKQKNQTIAQHPYGDNILQHTFRIFLYEMAAIAKKYNIVGINKISRKQDLVIKFGNLLNLHYKEERSVKYYANLLSITPKYLTEIVHEVTGKPAGELIEEKVIQEMKFLLGNPSFTIGQIADTLHFADQSFFRKFFKRHLGISPSEFRGGNSLSHI
ncbi:MAG TPA: helix-turn-helix domain-containing protein [Bacteroidia bacterium]|nr:helix-turn-helix domain-containing protein [Bacteroidia bacterium]